MEAVLDSSDMAEKMWGELPISGNANIWGNEIYFSINVAAATAKGASAVVKSGELAYWPPGKAFCIFFGKTPASINDEIRAASPVNVFGKIDGDERLFDSVAPGSLIQVEIVR